jgi:hypothetical protein
MNNITNFTIPEARIVAANFKECYETKFKTYFISDKGDIKSVDKKTKKPKFIKKLINKDGYVFYKNIKESNVHRQVWTSFMGEIPKGMEIDHINSLRSDNRLSNLRVVTKQQNLALKGSYKRSNVPRRPRMTQVDIEFTIAAYKSGDRVGKIAKNINKNWGSIHRALQLNGVK